MENCDKTKIEQNREQNNTRVDESNDMVRRRRREVDVQVIHVIALCNISQLANGEILLNGHPTFALLQDSFVLHLGSLLWNKCKTDLL